MTGHQVMQVTLLTVHGCAACAVMLTCYYGVRVCDDVSLDLSRYKLEGLQREALNNIGGSLDRRGVTVRPDVS